MHDTCFIPVELHEDVIPNFNIAIAIFIWTARGAARNMVAMVIENFCTRSTRTGIPHHPEIIRGVTCTLVVTDPNNPISWNADLLIPDLIRLIIFGIHSDQQFFFGQVKYLSQ